MKRWAEYRSDLYNYGTSGSQQHSTANKPLSILRENVEAAVKAMKMEKSRGTDSIAAELV